MSPLTLCHEKKATVPYFVETVGKHIYTIEELCYYFWNYAHLIDKDQLDSSLVTWIRDELQMEKLAADMERHLRYREEVEVVAETVFRSISYLTEEEFRQYVSNLRKLKAMTPFERAMRKADDLVRDRSYSKALQQYRILLKAPEAEEDEVASKIYHNMGVAYSKMCFFRKGSQCFLKAFLLVPSRESMRQYKVAIRLCPEELQEDELVAQFPSSETMNAQVEQDIASVREGSNSKKRMIQNLEQIKSDGNVAEYYQKLEEILQEWRGECREYMNIR